MEPVAMVCSTIDVVVLIWYIRGNKLKKGDDYLFGCRAALQLHQRIVSLLSPMCVGCGYSYSIPRSLRCGAF